MLSWFGLSVVISLLAILASQNMLFGKSWNPEGLHCYVTGGSTGLGLEVARLLVRKGANVSIVARDKVKLEKALQELEAARVNPNQKINSYSFSLTSASEAAAALEAASVPYGGKVPDAIFLCAGISTPKFFVDMSEQDLVTGMENTYWIQAWTAFAALKKMVQQGVKGKICFVSSTLGYMAFVGYGSYTPGKHAIRGLADTFRSEMILYGIETHIFFPCTMPTPGFDHENETKPKITRAIEEGDEGITPAKAAQGFLRGVEKGQFHISADLITSFFRVSTRGTAPHHNPVVDAVLGLIAWVGIPIWRWGADAKVRAHRQEHAEYLLQKGFLAPGPNGQADTT